MKTLLSLCLMICSFSAMSAQSNHYYELLLEDKLSFQGAVDVDSVTELDNGSVFVEFYVMAYGEERPNSCTLKNDEIVNCADNWFNY